MQSSSALFETLFKKQPGDSGNVEFLTRLTEDHPYFSPAQFFLLEQTEADATDHKNQAAKTGLLFNNPYWLNYQLMHSREPDTVLNEVTEVAMPLTNGNDDGSSMEKEIEPMKIELKIPAHDKAMDEMPLFEPMHMVDYFASQGIKLSEEAATADKLGKQLKSFTEWLKTMKKVHADKPTEASLAGLPTDVAIQTLAEKSNKENEVLTEAMAEVFAKQGKTTKATEVYEKLSLLDPSKIAYFAAKIEQLKGI